jgi:hypothetical protein
MKPNRIHGNGRGKTSVSQSAKSTKSATGKPVVLNRDKATPLLLAVWSILDANKTRFGLTKEAIADCLPDYGFKATADEVQKILDTMERSGNATAKPCGVEECWMIVPPSRPAENPLPRAPRLLTEDEIATNQSFEELDAAIEQAQALNALLEHAFLNPDDDGGGRWTGALENGLAELRHQTFSRLECAGDALRSQI